MHGPSASACALGTAGRADKGLKQEHLSLRLGPAALQNSRTPPAPTPHTAAHFLRGDGRHVDIVGEQVLSSNRSLVLDVRDQPARRAFHQEAVVSRPLLGFTQCFVKKKPC